jgi:hypothetical protein
MLSPFTPLDRARLLVLVRVRLFGQMLQHGHETIKTHTHLGVLFLEHIPGGRDGPPLPGDAATVDAVSDADFLGPHWQTSVPDAQRLRR